MNHWSGRDCDEVCELLQPKCPGLWTAVFFSSRNNVWHIFDKKQFSNKSWCWSTFYDRRMEPPYGQWLCLLGHGRLMSTFRWKGWEELNLREACSQGAPSFLHLSGPQKRWRRTFGWKKHFVVYKIGWYYKYSENMWKHHWGIESDEMKFRWWDAWVEPHIFSKETFQVQKAWGKYSAFGWDKKPQQAIT